MVRSLVLALVVSLIGADTASAQSAQLTTEQVGPIRLRMTEAQIRDLGFPVQRDVVNQEGDDYVRFVVQLAEQQSVEVIFWEGRAVDLQTAATALTTERGAHVGMTLSELQRLYPEGEVSIGRGEGPVFGFVTAPRGAIFWFSTRELPASCFEWRGECPDLSGRRATRYFIRDLDQVSGRQ